MLLVGKYHELAVATTVSSTDEEGGVISLFGGTGACPSPVLGAN